MGRRPHARRGIKAIPQTVEQRGMATSRAVETERRRRLPRLWAIVKAFLGHHGGKVHINWGAPFSVRTRLPEGRLEVDFHDDRRALLRLEGIALPRGVSFTTNREHFDSPYTRRIGKPAAHLGWKVRGDADANPRAIVRFLSTKQNVEALRRLDLGKTDWISIDSTSIFLGLTDVTRIDSVVATLAALVRRHAPARGPIPAPRSRLPRLTGRRPSARQLDRWPNWRSCLDEEDEQGQDESTMRPDDEQTVIGPETNGTAFTATDATGRSFSLFGLAVWPDDLKRGHLDQVVLLERPARTIDVAGHGRSWKPSACRLTLPPDSPRLPIRARSVLPLRDGRHLELRLAAGGRASCARAKR
jgi:hypothetical protein